METGTPQESLAPSSFLAGGQPVLCTGPEWDDRKLELAGNGGGPPRMVGLTEFEAKKGFLREERAMDLNSWFLGIEESGHPV